MTEEVKVKVKAKPKQFTRIPLDLLNRGLSIDTVNSVVGLRRERKALEKKRNAVAKKHDEAKAAVQASLEQEIALITGVPVQTQAPEAPAPAAGGEGQ